MILCVRTTPPIARKTQGLGSPLKNATSRGSRGNQAHISSEKAAIREPPHVGCYFLNRLIGESGLHPALHPLPARNERGEDRGEGKPIKTHRLSPARSSMRWRRGSNRGASCSPWTRTDSPPSQRRPSPATRPARSGAP